MIPINIPYQKQILEHLKEHPDHKIYTIYGTNKKEKLQFPFCKTCNKSIGVITVLSSKQRRCK